MIISNNSIVGSIDWDSRTQSSLGKEDLEKLGRRTKQEQNTLYDILKAPIKVFLKQKRWMDEFLTMSASTFTCFAYWYLGMK